MAESSSNIDVNEDDHIVSDKSNTEHTERKVRKLEKYFLVANFIVELPSAAFEQLSSVHKPQYALLSMLMSFIILIISIVDLVLKGQKSRVTWTKIGWFSWFYYPYPTRKPFGTFPDIVGLVCAIFQCIFASVAYTFLCRKMDNPVKVYVCPIIFALGLLCSRLSEKPPEKKSILKANRTIEFTLAELVAATNKFSLQNIVGKGSFGEAYRGKLADGSEVVVKRIRREYSEKEQRAFESELEFLSRLHHKHLIGLIGYYEDDNERLLVYEFATMGSLHHYLDHKNNVSNVIRSWKMRINIALDAARGIEYLHNYAVPTVIHGGLMSRNILLTGNGTAKVGEFTFSLTASESESGYRPMNAVGTVVYLDPEYYNQNIITTKSDVYSFGVVLLELLTGKTAMFKDDDNGGISTSVVVFAVPKIMSGEYLTALDRRIGRPKLNEAKAIEQVAYTALQCVNMEGSQRPKMSDIVYNLERCLALCDAGMNQDKYIRTMSI